MAIFKVIAHIFGDVMMYKLILCGVLAFLIFTPLAFATNEVSIQLIRSGDNAVVDKAFAGFEHEFRFTIENDFTVQGMSLGFLIYSNNGVTWTWAAQPGGFGDATQAVTVIPGSRLFPPEDVFDLTSLIVTERDVDGLSPDTLMFSGVAMFGGIVPGPPEAMVNYQFEPYISGDIAGTICIDSTFVPPSGAFIFMASADPVLSPDINGPYCWPVVEFEPILGDFDLDGSITVGDAVEMIGYVFFGKPHIEPIETGDVNCDGEMNVGDAIYLIQYIFMHGPAPGCL